jgi:hypothetical protein
MSIANLKRASAATFQQTRANVDADTSKRSYADERYWQPVVDKNNNGSAIIRFLPGILITNPDHPDYNSPYVQSLLRTAKVDDGLPVYEPPYVRKWTHGFKGPTGQWYIENNRNSLGTKEDPITDPCTDYNASLWKTKEAALMEIARKQKRKLLYISNVEVIKHAARPEDEGKVFLFAYGKKVFDKIDSAMNPDADDDVEPVDVFNLWKGANFLLKIKNVEGFRNYDDSKFNTPKPLRDSDDELEAIFNTEHSLLAEVSNDKFKSYDELEQHLHQVLNLKGRDVDNEPVPRATGPAPRSVTRVSAPVAETEEPPFDVDEDGVVTEKIASSSEDAKAYFKTLAVKKA